MYEQEIELILEYLKSKDECTYEEIHWDVLHTDYDEFKPILKLMLEKGLVIDNSTAERIKLK